MIDMRRPGALIVAEKLDLTMVLSSILPLLEIIVAFMERPSQRIAVARNMLAREQMSVAETALAVGYPIGAMPIPDYKV
ncbi:MAG: hypothetical protein WAV20_02180 [Blastocatellia bacterium]